MVQLVNDSDLVRARKDPAFRHQLLAENLDWLLATLKRLRRADDHSEQSTRQMREAVDLAVELANRLHRDGHGPSAAA